MNVNDFGRFNVESTHIEANIVKVKVSVLGELIINEQGRNEQPIISEFEFISKAGSIDGAERKALKRIAELKAKYGHNGDIRIQVDQPKVDKGAFIVGACVGIFEPVTEKFAGRGQAGLKRRVQTVGKGKTLESAQNKAISKAVKLLGLDNE